LGFDKDDCVPFLPQNFSPCPLKYILLHYVLYLSVGEVTRVEGKNTGIKGERTLCRHGESFLTGSEILSPMPWNKLIVQYNFYDLKITYIV